MEALVLSLFGGPPVTLIPIFCASPRFYTALHLVFLPVSCLHFCPALRLDPLMLCALILSILTVHLGPFHLICAL